MNPTGFAPVRVFFVACHVVAPSSRKGFAKLADVPSCDALGEFSGRGQVAALYHAPDRCGRTRFQPPDYRQSNAGRIRKEIKIFESVGKADFFSPKMRRIRIGKTRLDAFGDFFARNEFG